MSGGKQTTSTELPRELRPLATQYAQKAMDIGNNPYQAYTGQRFAGQNQDQGTAYSLLRQQAQGQTNPYLDQMVGRAQSNVISNYNNVIRPQQDTLAARSGSFGNSGVSSVIDQNQRMLGDQLGNIATDIYGGAYNADANRRAEATQNLLGAGNQQQMFAQQPLDFAYQQFQEAQNQPYRNLAAMGAPFGSNMGSQTSTSSRNDPLQTLIGIGLLGGSLFSDRNLKTDIKKVGKTDSGLNVYTYRYINSPTVHMGVMAQEVRDVFPEAVHEVGGFMAVDYSKVS